MLRGIVLQCRDMVAIAIAVGHAMFRESELRKALMNSPCPNWRADF